MITAMKETARDVLQAMIEIKVAGIHTIVQAVLMATVEVVHAREVLMTKAIVHVREVHMTNIKDQDVRVIAIGVVPTMTLRTQVVLQTVPAVEIVDAEIQEGVIQKIQAEVLPEIQAGVIQKVRAEVLPEIQAGVIQKIRAEVLREIRAEAHQETRAGVLQEVVVHKVAHAPVHPTEEDKILPATEGEKILPAPVAHRVNQVMVGKVQEDVKKVLQKVHRANTTIATRQRIGQAPYSLLFLHY